jgi:hypothetical protein
VPERSAQERRLGVRVRELRPDGSLVVARPRASYYVIEYLNLVGRGRSLTGVDLLADPVRRRAIERAERTGSLGVTAPLALAQNGQRGFAVYAASGTAARAWSVRASPSACWRGRSRAARAGHGRDRPDRRHDRDRRAARERQPEEAVNYGGLADVRPRRCAGQRRARPLGLITGLGLTLLALIVSSARRARRRLAGGEVRFADAFEASPIGQALASRTGASRA